MTDNAQTWASRMDAIEARQDLLEQQVARLVAELAQARRQQQTRPDVPDLPHLPEGYEWVHSGWGVERFGETVGVVQVHGACVYGWRWGGPRHSPAGNANSLRAAQERLAWYAWDEVG